MLDTIKSCYTDHKYICIFSIVIILSLVLYVLYIKLYKKESFSNAKTDNKRKQLILFFSKKCPHCNKLMDGDDSVWNTLVKKHKSRGDLQIEEIDCEKNQDAIEKYSITAFPTIKLLDNDKEYVYNGDNTLDSIEQFLSSPSS